MLKGVPVARDDGWIHFVDLIVPPLNGLVPVGRHCKEQGSKFQDLAMPEQDEQFVMKAAHITGCLKNPCPKFRSSDLSK